MAEVVLVTQPEFAKAEQVFRTASNIEVVSVPAQESSLAEAVLARNCRAVIVGVEKYRGPLYEALSKTGTGKGAIIARFGVGHDSVDKALARQHNITVTNTPGVLDASVAEHTMWLLGCLARPVAYLHPRMRAGEFAGRVGIEVRGKTLGLVGFGGIAKQVARIAHFGFGMRVIAAGRRTAEELVREPNCTIQQLCKDYGIEAYTHEADAVFRDADFVSIHLPATAATRHFANAVRLSLMKTTAFLINTGRGSLVDEVALFDALTAGEIAGAALDVFEREPYEPASAEKDLRKLENVVFTPHIGSNTREANARMAEASMRNVSNFYTGRFDALNRVG